MELGEFAGQDDLDFRVEDFHVLADTANLPGAHVVGDGALFGADRFQLAPTLPLLARQETVEGETIRGKPRGHESRQQGRSTWNRAHIDSRPTAGADQEERLVGDAGSSRIANQRETLATQEALDQFVGTALLVVVVVGTRLGPDPVSRQEPGRVPGILAEDLVDRLEDLQGANGDIGKISDRGADDMKGACVHGAPNYTWSTMLLHVTRNDVTAVVRVSGKVGWENSRVLDRQIETLVQAGVRCLIFHLAEIDFLSSGAIGVISYNWRRMKETEGDLLIVEPNDYVLYLFRSVGFMRVFEGRILSSMEDLDIWLSQRGLPTLAQTPKEQWESIDSSFDDDDELSYREDP